MSPKPKPVDQQDLQKLRLELEELERDMLLRLQTIRRSLSYLAGEEPTERKKPLVFRHPVTGKVAKIIYDPV